jgi:formate dehydrogenase subunit gamma
MGTHPRPRRFDGTERLLHWSTATLVGICLVTAACLSFPLLATIVGRRDVVKTIHVLAGLSLPLPLAIARLGPWSAALRADIRRLNRFDDLDRQWVRTLGRHRHRPGPHGKFNAGQKLNAAFDVGAVLLLLVTGSMMKWFGPVPLTFRTGATFVHDWTAFAFFVVLVGHVAKGISSLRQPLLFDEGPDIVGQHAAVGERGERAADHH